MNKIKNVITINRTDYDMKKSNGELVTLINNEQVKLIPIPVRKNELEDPVVSNLNKLGYLDTEQVLLRDIYDKDQFVPLDKFEKTMQLKKHMYFSLLCQMLGATELKINELNINTKQNNESMNIDGKGKHASGKININYDDYQGVSAELELHDIFDGNKPDIENAKNLLYRTGLYKDTQMLSIVEARSVKSNILKTRNLKINLSTTIKSQLSAVAKLGIPKLLEIETKLDNTSNKNEEIILDVTIKFNKDK